MRYRSALAGLLTASLAATAIPAMTAPAANASVLITASMSSDKSTLNPGGSANITLTAKNGGTFDSSRTYTLVAQDGLSFSGKLPRQCNLNVSSGSWTCTISVKKLSRTTVRFKVAVASTYRNDNWGKVSGAGEVSIYIDSSAARADDSRREQQNKFEKEGSVSETTFEPGGSTTWSYYPNASQALELDGDARDWLTQNCNTGVPYGGSDIGQQINWVLAKGAQGTLLLGRSQLAAMFKKTGVPGTKKELVETIEWQIGPATFLGMYANEKVNGKTPGCGDAINALMVAKSLPSIASKIKGFGFGVFFIYSSFLVQQEAERNQLAEANTKARSSTGVCVQRVAVSQGGTYSVSYSTWTGSKTVNGHTLKCVRV